MSIGRRIKRRQFRQSIVDLFFGSQNFQSFRLRIIFRIGRLGLKRSWQRTSFRSIWQFAPRPILLFLVGLGLPIILSLIVVEAFPTDAQRFSDAVGSLLRGDGGQEPLQWREAIQLLLLAVGIPAAFIIWLFRDQNMQATVENQRKDVNLKEFQELIVRAAGYKNDAASDGASKILEAAAVHQLRSYLRGDFGEGFRRPAWELLKAKLAAKRDLPEFTALQNFLASHSYPSGILKDDIDLEAKKGFEASLSNIVGPLRLLRNDEPVNQVVSDEIGSICSSKLPTNYSNFAQIHFKSRTMFSGCDLREAVFVSGFLGWCNFEFADLWRAEFQQADLSFGHFEFAKGAGAHFELANLMGAVFDRSQFLHASFIGADLSSASFRFSDLRNARFDGNQSTRRNDFRGSDLESANFQLTDMSYCNLEGCRLRGTKFTDANLFHANLRDTLFGDVNTIPFFVKGAGSRFKGADLTDAQAEGADLRGIDPTALKSCQGLAFDRTTILGCRDNSFNGVIGNSEWDKAAAEWIERGAILVDKRQKWPNSNANLWDR